MGGRVDPYRPLPSLPVSYRLFLVIGDLRLQIC
jgi:hypothetical protein